MPERKRWRASCGRSPSRCASASALATPTKDMVLGTYYLTYCESDLAQAKAEDFDPRPKRFASEEEVEHALDADQVKLQQPIEYRWNGDLLLTTPGRVIFNTEVERALQDAFGEDGSEITFQVRGRIRNVRVGGCFRTDNVARAKVHLRLVPQLQPIAIERLR